MTPFQLLNRFSFLIFPLLLFAAGAAVLLWRRARWPWWAGWATLLAAFLVLALTSGQRTSPRYDTPENIRQALASAGQPTLVEFFSNYWLACVSNRPLVQRLEEEWTDGQVVTLDAMDPQIRAFGQEVDFQVTPTFILFDGQGREIRRWVGRAPSLEELAREWGAEWLDG